MEEEGILKRIREDVISFDMDDIKEAARLALKAGIPPERVINEAMADGMKVVGERYENDEYYLPDLIMAGETMNEGTKILFSGERRIEGPGAPVVLATVKGDIHDIGKNVLSNFLNGVGIRVHDLGVDVSSEEIVETVRKYRPAVLGLSALLSTTKDEIKEVIKELEKSGLRKDVKIIIGGLPTDRGFARKAGGDAYAEDAVEGVKIIKKWVRGML
ncbi:MAG: cobalamin-dependent protein [Candidatus Hydrothermarchaeaceae archaeon]